jgi:outer membrane protein assembly factor BamB
LSDVPAGLPAFDDDRTYVPLRNNRLVGVGLGAGTIEWSVDISGRPTLAAGGGLVFLTAPASIEARAGTDGALRWRVALDGDVAGGIAWNHGWLIAVTAAGTAVAIRALDGQVIWQKALGGTTAIPPALSADRAYFALADGRVVARQLLTGEPVWERKLGGPPAPMLPLDDRLFVGAKDHFFYCLATRDGGVKWRWRTGGEVVGAPVVDERRVFFASLDNVIRALDRGNGHQRWNQFLGTRPTGGPLHFERDVVLVAGIAATVWVYRGADGKLTGEISTPAELAVPPFIVHAGDRRTRMLLVLTLEGQIQAYGLAPIGHAVPGLPLFLPLPEAEGAWPPRV